MNAPWRPAYVGLGSNLDSPAEQIRRALRALRDLPATRLYRQSSLYGSHPLDGSAQPDYVNAAAGLVTQLEVHPFFEALRALEIQLGRPAMRERWAPRCIDLDLLLFGQLVLEDSVLALPHPGLLTRPFVLWPLVELAPQLHVPRHGRVADLAARLGRDGLWLLGDTGSGGHA